MQTIPKLGGVHITGGEGEVAKIFVLVVPESYVMHTTYFA